MTALILRRTRARVVPMLLSGLSASLMSLVAEAACDSARNDIFVGGTVGFADMANADNTVQLRATCRVGLYIHDYIWSRLSKEQATSILQVFEDTGPQVLELGAVHKPDQYWGQRYKDMYEGVGVRAEQAHIDGVGRLTVEEWKGYVDAGRAFGIKLFSPIFSPNSGQWKTAAFADPKWDDIRAEARYGGGITIDSPPNFFLSAQPGYQAFVEDEIRWARSMHLQSTVIISPNVSGAKFEKATGQMLDRLAADHALPDMYIVENYRPLPVAAGYLNSVGSEKDPISINGVALWIARHRPRAE